MDCENFILGIFHFAQHNHSFRNWGKPSTNYTTSVSKILEKIGYVENKILPNIGFYECFDTIHKSHHFEIVWRVSPAKYTGYMHENNDVSHLYGSLTTPKYYCDIKFYESYRRNGFYKLGGETITSVFNGKNLPKQSPIIMKASST